MLPTIASRKSWVSKDKINGFVIFENVVVFSFQSPLTRLQFECDYYLFLFFPSSLSLFVHLISTISKKNKPLIDSCCRIFSWRVICCLYFKKRCR